MKQQRKFQQRYQAALVGLVLAASTSGVFAVADRIVSTFDADITVASDGGGWPGNTKTLAWASTVDANNSPSSGSLYVVVSWPNGVSGWQDSKVNLTDPGLGDFAWPGIDCRLYVKIEFDVKIDVANSFPTTDGTYGGVQVIIQGWEGANGNPPGLGWTPIGTAGFAATNGWQHCSVSLTPYPYNANKLVLNLYGNPVTNNIAYWIDNIKFTTPPAPPPSLDIAKAPPGGLTCVASRTGDTYQRQIIRTLNGSYSWNTAAAASNTTTYAMTIADFPGVQHAGFIAQMFLVPQYIAGDTARTNMQYGPTDSSIDWNSGSVIYWTIGANTNGTATANWRFKTNEFGGQDMAFNDQPGGQYGTNGWPAGHLAVLNCATGAKGKWTVAFNNNTNVTCTAPDGSFTNFTITATAGEIFKDPLYAYFGVQPNANSRIGQSATFSRIQIDGASVPLDDTFTNGSPPLVLDSLTWTPSAAAPTGIFITDPLDKFWVAWTTPDPGYTNVFVTDKLTNSLSGGQWLDSTLTPSKWIVIGEKHVVRINQATLDTVFTYTPTNVFFGLWKVE